MVLAKFLYFKSCFLISKFVDMPVNRIVIIEENPPIYMKNLCIHNESLFGVDYDHKALLVCTFYKILVKLPL